MTTPPDQPLLSPDEVRNLIGSGGHTPVAQLAILPTDSGGTGFTGLYHFPASAEHRETWAVVVAYPFVAGCTEDCSTHPTEQAAKDAHTARVEALQGPSCIPPGLVGDVLTTRGHTPVAVLERLPNDGIGVGDAFLYCIPASTVGADESRYGETWLVSVEYDGDSDGDFDFTTRNTEQEARQAHSERVEERLAAGYPAPSGLAGEQTPRRQRAGGGHPS